MLPGRIYRLLAVALSLVVGAVYGDESPPTITVTGSAAVHVVPDQVTLRIGIESRAKELSVAANDNSAKVTKVGEFLRSEDVPERSVRTESLLIKPIFKRTAGASAPKQNSDPFAANLPPDSGAEESDQLAASGYIVERRLSIAISQVERFEQIYQGLIERGVNEVDSIVFSSTEIRGHRQRARIDAARAAKEKAELLAGELGARLAGVESITEVGSDGYGRQNALFEAPFGMPTDGGDRIASGEIEITAAVSVIFRLKSTELE